MSVANIIIALIVGLIFALAFVMVAAIAGGLSRTRQTAGKESPTDGQLPTPSASTGNRVAFFLLLLVCLLALVAGYLLPHRG